MNPRHIRTLLAAISLTVAGTAYADDADETPHLKFSPIGTILLDGATYFGPDHSDFPSGVAIPEARIGVNASYGRWAIRIEVGTAYNKVALKDVYFQYEFNPQNRIRLGALVHHFGYQNATAACMKATMIEPMSNTVFNTGQMLGLQYYHTGDKLFATASVHAEPDAISRATGGAGLSSTAYGIRTRLAWHPLISSGRMFQIGASGAFMTPDGENHDSFTLSSNFPTKVAQVTAVKAVIGDARNRWQFSPELMASYGRVALEGQYIYARVNRKEGLPGFDSWGAYATLRGIVKGPDYTYSKAAGGIGLPAPGSLEALVTYNYTTLNDAGAGIWGGRTSDIAGVVNYYINPWMIARLRYGYTWVHDRAAEGPDRLGVLQARLMVLF